MCTLIVECGITTTSWYAEFALRRRVSMSAIGSVIVMCVLLPRPVPLRAYDELFFRDPRQVFEERENLVGYLPGGLGDAGQLARVRHLAEADAAQAELAVD